MLGSRSQVVARRFDQLSTAQILERALHSALGKAGRFRKRAQTRGHRSPFRARRLAVEMQINEIRGRLSIMPDDIAHQDVEDVIVDWNCVAKTGQVQKDEG